MNKTTLGIVGVFLLIAGSYSEEQPIPYSHKTHLAMGLKCDSCHRNADPGDLMGFPEESLCMGCHDRIRSDSPHIQKLAAANRDKKSIPWVRVYELPTFVYFSHRVHTKASVKCETCHGPVQERALITREIVHDMRSCMACHTATAARNDCTACHDERH